MKISLTIYIDPIRLNPKHELHEVHLRVAEAFSKILNEETLIKINGFEISCDYDQDAPDVPSTVVYDWLKRFTQKGWGNQKQT